jgi:hypothetical protein
MYAGLEETRAPLGKINVDIYACARVLARQQGTRTWVVAKNRRARIASCSDAGRLSLSRALGSLDEALARDMRTSARVCHGNYPAGKYVRVPFGKKNIRRTRALLPIRSIRVFLTTQNVLVEELAAGSIRPSPKTTISLGDSSY